MIKLFYFVQINLFARCSSNSSIWPIDRTLSVSTIPGKIGPENDGNEGVLHIPRSSRITNTSSSDCLVLLLHIDLRPCQTCHSKVMHRKEVTHCDGSYEKKSRTRAWLTIWDKVKSHGTFIDWCTEREWHVNCITVISAWWRSNMPFQRYWVGDWTII